MWGRGPTTASIGGLYVNRRFRGGLPVGAGALSECSSENGCFDDERVQRMKVSVA